jgi:hypothetical protein
MFMATHLPSGQVFFVKNDKYGDQIVGRTGVSRDAEMDVNELFRRMGMQGVGAGAPSNVERSTVIHQRVGDSLPLDARPKNAGQYSSRVRQEAFANLENIEDAFKMLLGDAAGGNIDRHSGNYQLGKDSYGKWWLFPIDHGLLGGGSGWQWADATTPASFIKDRLMASGRSDIYSIAVRNAARGMGEGALRTLLTDLIAGYRSSISQGGFADPQFQTKMDARFNAMENGLDELIRAIMGRR